VDLLVHEVVAAEFLRRTTRRPERAQAVIEHHATPEQAGEVFAKTNPRLAVYSRIVPPTATEQDLIPAT
jgi:ribonuclease Z